jgi:large subunit ribosomal protein L31
MKKDLHPTNYRYVVFEDLNNGTKYLTRSTVSTEDKTTLDGVEYPLVKVHISSSSHPFFTGEERIVDIEGRVDKFKNRAAAAQKALDARKKSAAKVRVRKTDEDDEEDETAVVAKAPAPATVEPATADK